MAEDQIFGDMSLQALEKAKEASRKERTLVRQREQSDKADQINIDLYGSVSKAGVQHSLLVKGDSIRFEYNSGESILW